MSCITIGTRVYISLSADHANKVSGMCGNFNGDVTDEFIVDGVDHGTAVAFGNANKEGTCDDTEDDNIDPCAVSNLYHLWVQMAF